MNRHTLATKYIRGSGVEIGAGHAPMPNPNGAAIIYVDRHTRDELLSQFPEESRDRIPETTYVRDGFTDLPINGVDFVVNSHVLEHTPDPVGALKHWLDRTRVGGHVVMAIPDKTECFDRDRDVTPYTDLVRTQKEMYFSAFKIRQYIDWCQSIDRLEGKPLRDRVMAMVFNDDHIHFCVWDEPAARDFFINVCANVGAKLVEFQKVGHEFFVVLEKL